MPIYQNENQFDAIDQRILKILSVNARIPYSKLAVQLNVSNSLIHQRIRKLEESGVLKKAVFQIDPESIGYFTAAYTQIIIKHGKYFKAVTEKLKEIPFIVECVNIAGRYALMVKIHAKDNRHLRDIIYDDIHNISGVEETNTVIMFETVFRRQAQM